jgi:hypothetical protein
MIHLPGWLDLHAEELLLRRLESDPPSAVVLFDRPTGEFRVKPFGQGFGRTLSEWIDLNYEVVLSVPAGKILRWRSHGVASFLEDDRHLASDEPHCGSSEPFNSEKEGKGPSRDNFAKPNASRERIEKRRVISLSDYGKARKLTLESASVSLKDDPGLWDIRSGEASGRGEPPIRGVRVVGFTREETIEPFPKDCVGRFNEHDPSGGDEYPCSLSKKGARVRNVVKHVEHQQRRHALVGNAELLRIQGAIDVCFRNEVSRDDVGKNLFHETSTRSDLNHRSAGNIGEVFCKLPIVLSIDILEKWFSFDHLPVDVNKVR